MERRKVFAQSVILLFLTGCTTTVNLSLTNPEKYPQAARLIDRADPNAAGTEIALGEVPANGGTVNAVHKIKHGHTIQVQGIYQGSRIYNGSPQYVGSKPDPLSVSYTMLPNVRWLDDSTSLQNISDAFKAIGVPMLAKPESLTSAVPSLFGALLVITPGDDKKSATIHYTITAGELGVKQIDLASALALVPDIHETSAIEITKNTAASLSAGFPLALVGGSYSDTDVYKLHWELSGFGYIQKPEDPDKGFATRFAALDKEHKDLVNNSLKAHSGAKLIYVNRLYVIKSATVNILKGINTAARTDIKATVITASGSYGFEENMSGAKAINNIVLNLDGDEVTPVTIAVTNTAATGRAGTYTLNMLATNHASLQAALNDAVRTTNPSRLDLLMPTGKRYTIPVSLAIKAAQR